MLSEALVVAIILAAQVPRRMPPAQHRVALALHPRLVVGHHARQTGRVEQRLVRKRNVDQRRGIGGPQRVAQDVANHPRMLAREVHKRKRLLLARELSDVARGRRQVIQHRTGLCRRSMRLNGRSVQIGLGEGCVVRFRDRVVVKLQGHRI